MNAEPVATSSSSTSTKRDASQAGLPEGVPEPLEEMTEQRERASPRRREEDDTGELEEGDSKRPRIVGSIASMNVEEECDNEYVTLMDTAILDEDSEIDYIPGGPEDKGERAKMNREGVQLELARFVDFNAFEAVQRSVVKEQGKKIIKTGWVKVFKQHEDGIWFLRARFVGKEIAYSPSFAYFAPTTSVSTARLLDILGAKKHLLHFTIDASNAFLHAPVAESEQVFVEPPLEWQAEHGVDKVWRMKRWLYGLRRAPQAWLQWISSIMVEKLSFKRCVVDPCFFVRGLGDPGKALYIELHMDDFHGVGASSEEIKSFFAELSQFVLTKCSGPYGEGARCTHLRRDRVLQADGIKIYPSSKYILDVLMLMEMQNCRTMATPRVDLPEAEEKRMEAQLDRETTRTYRSVVGKLLYLSLDRHDIAFGVKELSRKIQQPQEKDMHHLKRMVRYVAGTKDAYVWIDAGGSLSELKVYSDSDHAGDKETRRSTSGLYITWGGSPVTASSRTQSIVSTSSAEAEYYALASAGSEAIHISSLLNFFEVTHATQLLQTHRQQSGSA